MNDTPHSPTRDKRIWLRALYTLVFAIAWGITELLLTLIVLFQLVVALFTGHVNEALLKFSSNLTAYAYQVFRYVTFNSENRPYPFDDFPDEAPGDGPWRSTAGNETFSDQASGDEASGDDASGDDAGSDPLDQPSTNPS